MRTCSHCGQANADWATECGRCQKTLLTFKSLDIDDAFENYMRAVNPTVQQESAQYRESRRCFMAGMWQMLQHMMHASSDLTESAAMREIAQLEDQLKQFKERVKHDKD